MVKVYYDNLILCFDTFSNELPGDGILIHEVHEQLDMWRLLERHCREAANQVKKRDFTLIRYYLDTARTELAYLEREKREGEE